MSEEYKDLVEDMRMLTKVALKPSTCWIRPYMVLLQCPYTAWCHVASRERLNKSLHAHINAKEKMWMKDGEWTVLRLHRHFYGHCMKMYEKSMRKYTDLVKTARI